MPCKQTWPFTVSVYIEFVNCNWEPNTLKRNFIFSNLWFYFFFNFFNTYLWYWACRKLNSSLIRSMDSTMFNLNGWGWPPGCVPPGICNINKILYFSGPNIKWTDLDSLFNFSSSDILLQISNSLCLDLR